MNFKKWYPPLSLIGMHLLLMLASFPQFFRNRGNSLFCNWGDGIKNYFTLLSFVKEPVGSEGIYKYNNFFYPFGDYVYYTDNTPAFSILYRWFCHSVCDVSTYTIPVFNTFILLNIIISAIFIYYIFNRFIGKNIISFVMAVYLPWVNIQAMRIWAGHFNLSLSFVILLAIVLCILWHNNRQYARKRILNLAAMLLLVIFAFLLHGYYIAILLLFIPAILFFTGIFFFKSSYGKQSIFAALLLVIIAGGISFLLMSYTDKYLPLRADKAMLYDWSIFKTNFLLLFTHYDFHSLGFPVASTRVINTESMVYLGNVGLFSFGAIWTGAVFSPGFRKRVFSIQKKFFTNPFRKAIFFSGLLLLFVSFGEWYTSNNDRIDIYTPFLSLNNFGTNAMLIFIGIVILITYLFILILNKKARTRLKEIGEDYKKHPWRKAKLLFCVALMIYLFIARYSITVINIFNPLLYLHFITKRVEQFRCLDRFIWPFYWVFYLWIIYTIFYLYLQYSLKTKRIILALIIFVGALEVKDYVLQFRKVANFENVFDSKKLKPFNRLKIDYKQFQSILPIPYYVVGSEDYPHTIDDDNDWTIYTMQLSLYSNLPLMSGKMSRTPPQYSIDLLNFVAKDSLQPSIINRMNNKSILVVANSRLINDPNQINKCAKDRQVTRDYYAKANEFVTRHHLSPIDSMGPIYFYRYEIKRG